MSVSKCFRNVQIGHLISVDAGCFQSELASETALIREERGKESKTAFGRRGHLRPPPHSVGETSEEGKQHPLPI